MDLNAVAMRASEQRHPLEICSESRHFKPHLRTHFLFKVFASSYLIGRDLLGLLHPSESW